MATDFKCARCGWCCRNIVINVAYSDIVKWFNKGRNDILGEVSFINNYPKKGTGGFYIAKTAFNPKQPCPFLNENSCKIYKTRPTSCRDFPFAHQRESNCLGSKGFQFDKTLEHTVKRAQYNDFKMAFENRKQLLNNLIAARNE